MTTATMALTELAEKGADIDALRQMVQFMPRLLLDRGARVDAMDKEDLTPLELALRSTGAASSPTGSRSTTKRSSKP